MTEQITPFPDQQTDRQKEAAEIVRRTMESLYEIFPFFKRPSLVNELRQREAAALATAAEKTNEAA